MDNTTETPITVVAELLPGRPDPSTTARFANGTRAQQYADVLAASGDYAAVLLTDADGRTWNLTPARRA